MKKIVSLMLAMIMAVSMLAACSKSEPAPAAEGGEEAATETAAAELTLNVASNATDETNPYSIGLEEFKKVAEEVSGGKIAVTVHKGTLGQNESELVEKLQMGAADMIVAAPAFMNAIGVPEVDFFSLEYLFDGFAGISDISYNRWFNFYIYVIQMPANSSILEFDFKSTMQF